MQVRSRMKSRGRLRVRSIAAILAVVVLLLVAAVVGQRLGDLRGGGVAASPAPTASPTLAGATPTATPTATASAAAAVSPSPTAVGPSDRYGYVFAFEDGPDKRIYVRREPDAAPQSRQGATTPTPGPPVFELAGRYPAVSADGKRLAYWRVSSDGSAKDLRVLDVADPTSDHSVLVLTGDRRGGDVVWSNDGQGLLAVTARPQPASGGPPGGCSVDVRLVTVDLATAQPRTQDRGGATCELIPVAWDRPARVAAAVGTGEGGYAIEYVTWNGNAADPLVRMDVPRGILAMHVLASTDAKLVLAIDFDTGGALRVWPVADVSKAESIRRPSRINSAFWRPGASAPYEVIANTGGRVELLRYPGGTSTTLYTGTDQSVAAVAARPDGSALLVTERGGGLPVNPDTRVFVVDVATGQAKQISTTAGSIGSGVRLASSRGVLLR